MFFHSTIVALMIAIVIRIHLLLHIAVLIIEDAYGESPPPL